MYIVVHGGWSSWIREPCSKTCGGGVQNITRECNNPRPSCGGNDCNGRNVRQERCNNNCCPGKKIYVNIHNYCITLYMIKGLLREKLCRFYSFIITMKV